MSHYCCLILATFECVKNFIETPCVRFHEDPLDGS
jgi:hypothetical protein